MFSVVLGNSCASETWQSALASMPLTTNVHEINSTNFLHVMLESFGSNNTVKALVLMPGSTDEFYMFRRAKAVLTNSSPTLLDAVNALTNQTYIQATFRPPFLLLRTIEDPAEPIVTIQDAPTSAMLKERKFEPHSVYIDNDWDYMLPHLGKSLKVALSPGLYDRESFHFYRHSFAAWNLSGWEAMQAVALAGKTTIKVSSDWLIFSGDTRTNGGVPGLKDWRITK